MKILIPLCIFLIGGCSLLGTVTAKKGTRYLIEADNKSYIFVVTKIRREKSETLLTEGIEYQLYPKENSNDNILTTFIKYRRTKADDHSYDLKRLDGTDQIGIDKLSFTWSYGSDDYIYLYLKDGIKIKRWIV